MAPTKPRPSARTKIPPIRKLRVQDPFDRLLHGNSTLCSLSPPSLTGNAEKSKENLQDDESKRCVSPVAGPSSLVSDKAFRSKYGPGTSRSKQTSRRTKPKNVPPSLFFSFEYCSPARAIKKRKPSSRKRSKQSKVYKEYTQKVKKLWSFEDSNLKVPLFSSTPIAPKSSRRLSPSGLTSSTDRRRERVDLSLDLSSIPNRTGLGKEVAERDIVGPKLVECDISMKVEGAESLEDIKKSEVYVADKVSRSSTKGGGSLVSPKSARECDLALKVEEEGSLSLQLSPIAGMDAGSVIDGDLADCSATTREFKQLVLSPKEKSVDCETDVNDLPESAMPIRHVSAHSSSAWVEIDLATSTKQEGHFPTSETPAGVSDVNSGREPSSGDEKTQDVAQRKSLVFQLTSDSGTSVEREIVSSESKSSIHNYVKRTQRRLFVDKGRDQIPSLSSCEVKADFDLSVQQALTSSVNDSLFERFERVSLGENDYQSFEFHDQSLEDFRFFPNERSYHSFREILLNNTANSRSNDVEVKSIGDEENQPSTNASLINQELNENSEEEGGEAFCDIVNVSQHSSDPSFEQDHVSFSQLENDVVCGIIGASPGCVVGMQPSLFSETSSRSNSLTHQNVSLEEEALSSARESGASSPVEENDSEEISIDTSDLPASGGSQGKLARISLSSPASYSSGDSEKSSSSPEASHSEDEITLIQQTRYRSDMSTVRYNNSLYDIPENQEHSNRSNNISPRRTRLSTRRSTRAKEEKAPGKLINSRPSTVGAPDLNVLVEEETAGEPDSRLSMGLGQDSPDQCIPLNAEHLVLCPGKKYRKSLAIIRLLADEETRSEGNDSTVILPGRGRHFGQSVEEVLRLQSLGPFEECANRLTPVSVMRRRFSVRRSSIMKQCTPPPRRRVKHSIYSTPVGTMSLASPSYSAGSCQSLADVSIDQTEISIKDIVFKVCDQTGPISFEHILDEMSFNDVSKVGEGVYGEVFFVNRGSRKNVFKIIPIEGDMIVNGERQKRYEEIYTELIITRELNLLTKNEQYMCSGFAELIAPSIVRGRYPPQFIEMWLDFDETRGSDNENPNKFGDNQLYLILELGNGGMALEDYSFSTARQTLSIFKQVVLSLAVAERSLEFEHRDLHWGNILVSRITERYVSYVLDGREYSLPTNCVKATIIDYTLSRMTPGRNNPIYNDIGKDPDMFVATGDYQFDIYRYMKKDVGNDWSRFVPKTNVRWLHYVIDKMINTVKYQRRSAKIHGDSMKELNAINNWILTCESSYDVAMRLFH